jgi:hypothetical protein
MGSIGKSFTLILILIIAISSLSLIIVKPASAQSIPNPSVPEFSVQYVNHPYDLAPTSTVDPYTGKTIVTSQGGHFDNFSIEVKIKNQAFISSIDSSGNYTSLSYNLRFKGHYENETKWVYYPVIPTDYGSASHPVDPFQTGARGSKYLDASKSDYSVFTLPKWQVSNVPQGGQIDVQVQTLIGHDNMHDWGMGQFGELITYYFEGEYTEWSSTQTVTIGQTSTSNPTQNPTQTPTNTVLSTPTPTVPEFSLLAILPLLFSMFFITVILRHRKTISQNKPNV